MNQVSMWSRIMVVLCCVHRGALGQRQTVVDPVSGVTFSLYGEDVEWTWERAYNHCVSVGQRLAVIDNSSKQEAVNRFTETGHAWIGGRRSSDVTWRWISGEEYEYDDRDGYLFNNIGPRCGAVDRSSSPSVHPSGCVVIGPLPAVCQRRAQGASQRYWVTDITFVSWNDARVSCLDQVGDLAHPASQQNIQGWKQQMVDLIALPVYQAWIGLSRHSWSWVTGDHTTLQAYRSVTYTHFSRAEGGGSNEICAHLDMKTNNDNSWADKSCDFPSRFFVCDAELATVTTSTWPTDPPTTFSYSHKTDGDISNAGAAIQPTLGPDVAAVYRLLWVIMGVCGILVVAIVVIVTICLITNRKLKKACSAATATVPVVTPLAAVRPYSSHDNEGSYGNLRASQIESRDPKPYERLGDGAHYDLVGDPETGVEANGGRRIYQNVD